MVSRCASIMLLFAAAWFLNPMPAAAATVCFATMDFAPCALGTGNDDERGLIAQLRQAANSLRAEGVFQSSLKRHVPAGLK